MSEQEIDVKVVNEAMVPDLTEDEVTILGRKIKIKPLKLRYQIEFAQVLEPYSTDAAYEVQTTGGVMTALSKALNHTEILPKAVVILAKNDGVELTEQELLDSDIQLDELISPLIALAGKNERIGKPVIDFFAEVLPAGRGQIGTVLAGMRAGMKQTLHSIFTALSSDSATNTAGD